MPNLWGIGGILGGGATSGAGQLWSRAHLHQLMQTLAKRPANDESLSEAVKDDLLTMAQAHWYHAIAAVAPEALYGPPVQMTTRDGGLTYEFGRDDANELIQPFGHVELLHGQRGARLVLPGVSWAPEGFLVEGSLVRWADGRAHLFPRGLWARMVVAPGVIDADHEPTLMPKEARVLLVFRALSMWAPGVRRDPNEFLDQEARAFRGDPALGDYGILGRLRTAYNLVGAQAVPEEGRWWDSPDLDDGFNGYTR